MNRSNDFNLSNLLIGILAIIVSIIAFRNPMASLVSIVIWYAIFAIIRGILEIMARNRLKKIGFSKHNFMLASAIINIIFGILLLFNIEIGVITLPIIFAIWFMLDSIMGIFLAKPIKSFNNKMYWFIVILNIIGAIIGFMLLRNPVSSMFTVAFLVGFYFMMNGIRHIVQAF